MTTPLPSMKAPFCDVRVTINGKEVVGKAFLIPPWNSFLQQFVQAGAEVVELGTVTNPFGPAYSYTANANGTLIVKGTPATINLIRGKVTIPLALTTEIIPIRINDTVTVTGSPELFFLPD